MWVIYAVLAAIAIIIINNWVQINILVHRIRFPELGPQQTVEKLLKECNGYLYEGDVFCNDCDGLIWGLLPKMIKAIIKQEGLDCGNT